MYKKTLFGAISLLLLFLTACGSGGSDASPTTPLSNPQPNTTAVQEVITPGGLRLKNINDWLTYEGKTIDEYLNEQFDATLPDGGLINADNQVFTSYNKNGSSTYSKWALALDLTGVAWSSTKAGTLVTSQHIIMANHYKHKVGTAVTFHAKDGTPYVRYIQAVTSLQKLDPMLQDAAILKLDAPLPSSIKVYPILFRDGFNDDDLVGMPYIMTSKYKEVWAEEVKSIQYRYPSFFGGQKMLTIQGGARAGYRHHNTVSGDSGNPSFVRVGDELAVTVTLTSVTGGSSWGPYYGDITFIDAMDQAIADMEPIINTPPSPITNLKASTDLVGKVKLTYSTPSAYPPATVDLYQNGTLVKQNIYYGYQHPVGAGTYNFQVKAHNIAGEVSSNIVSGEAL